MPLFMQAAHSCGVNVIACSEHRSVCGIWSMVGFCFQWFSNEFQRLSIRFQYFWQIHQIIFIVHLITKRVVCPVIWNEPAYLFQTCSCCNYKNENKNSKNDSWITLFVTDVWHVLKVIERERVFFSQKNPKIM